MTTQPDLRIFVTVGTHEQGFPRLLSAVSELIGIEPECLQWRVQTGPAKTAYPAFVEFQTAYSHSEMILNLEWADVMISQASPGNVFNALAALSQPIVIPRRADLSEHVDNHQAIFARYAAESGLAMAAHDVASIDTHLKNLRSESRHQRQARLLELSRLSRERTAIWTKKFGRVTDDLLGR